MLLHCEELTTTKTMPFRHNPLGRWGLQSISLLRAVVDVKTSASVSRLDLAGKTHRRWSRFGWYRSLIDDPMAQCSPGCHRERLHELRQLVEIAFARDQCVQRGIAEQSENELHAASRSPPAPLDRGDGTYLRCAQTQASAVESLSQCHRRPMVPIPAQLDDLRLETGETESGG